MSLFVSDSPCRRQTQVCTMKKDFLLRARILLCKEHCCVFVQSNQIILTCFQLNQVIHQTTSYVHNICILSEFVSNRASCWSDSDFSQHTDFSQHADLNFSEQTDLSQHADWKFSQDTNCFEHIDLDFWQHADLSLHHMPCQPKGSGVYKVLFCLAG